MSRRPSRPRRPGRRRRVIATVVLSVLVVGAVAGAGWLVYFSKVLATTQVTVVGTHHLTAAQIRTAAQVPIGRPLARQDLDAIARRTTSLPAVEAAQVRRVWPHTIQVSITERRPLLAVPQPDGFAVVDHLGVAYETRSVMPAGTLQANVDPGNVALLTQVGVVTTALPSGLRDKVRYVHATTRNDIELTLKSGVVVTWGDADDSALKAQVATLVLKRKPAVSVDVSSPHNPALR